MRRFPALIALSNVLLKLLKLTNRRRRLDTILCKIALGSLIRINLTLLLGSTLITLLLKVSLLDNHRVVQHLFLAISYIYDVLLVIIVEHKLRLSCLIHVSSRFADEARLRNPTIILTSRIATGLL